MVAVSGGPDSLALVALTKAYTFFNSDICNLDDLVGIFKKEQPDSVMHLAAESHVDNSIYNPAAFIDANIRGTTKLLNYAMKNNIENFVHISTDEVYGDLEGSKDFFTEDSYSNKTESCNALCHTLVMSNDFIHVR